MTITAAAQRDTTTGLSVSFLVTATLIWGVAALRLFYGTASGEHDTFMMAAGIVHGWHSGTVINALTYGPDLQYTFYYALHFAQILGIHDTRGVLLAMNIVGVLCSLAIPILLVTLLSRLSMDPVRARFASLLLMTSPVYLMLVPYGHPFHFAMTLSLSAWVAAFPPTGELIGWRFLLGLCLQALALMIRLDQVVLMGIMIGVLYVLSRNRSRLETAWAVGFMVIPALPLLWVHATVSQGPTGDKVAFLLLRGFERSRFGWSVAHLFVEVGGALVMVACWIATGLLAKRQGRVLAAAAVGIIPTIVVYAGNPSPPRHFYVAAIGLAYLVASGWSRMSSVVMRIGLAALLVGNVLAPWVLSLPRKFHGEMRPLVTYNVVERRDRNVAQTAAARDLYGELIRSSRGRPVAVFGNWVQVSELCAEFADDSLTGAARTVLFNGVRPFVLTRSNVTFYLVEAYTSSTVTATERELRRLAPGVQCFSLVPAAPLLNDLGIEVSARVHEWSS